MEFWRVRGPDLGILGARFWGFGGPRTRFGVLGADFGLILGFWRPMMGFGRVQGPDLRALGADFDLILELSWALGAIFRFGWVQGPGGLFGRSQGPLKPP